MKYGIYAIYDVAMKRFTQPFYHPNDEVAKRAFKLAINNPQAENLYPIREDLELWYLGRFDDSTGIIENKAIENDRIFDDHAPTRILNRGEAVIHTEKKEEAQDEV